MCFEGVFTAETRTTEVHVAADPARAGAEAQRVQQAGQVWYPASAYKTAQAIEDLHRERLPLLILANWRGFASGMREMYEQVLKFGAMIVDGLVRYTAPVFIYIYANAELRGGAWAVMGTRCNARLGAKLLLSTPTYSTILNYCTVCADI